MAAIGSNRAYSKRELLDDAVDAVDGIGLGVTLVDLQCANPGRVVDCRVPIAPHRPASPHGSGFD